MSQSLISQSPEETVIIGARYAKGLEVNTIVGLFGNLGSGKTQFVKGICQHFRVRDIVNSPTFILMNQYKGYDNFNKPLTINHFDLYRLKNHDELIELGIESYANQSSVCLIEWAELWEAYSRDNLAKVYFDFGNNTDERIINFEEWEFY